MNQANDRLNELFRQAAEKEPAISQNEVLDVVKNTAGLAIPSIPHGAFGSWAAAPSTLIGAVSATVVSVSIGVGVYMSNASSNSKITTNDFEITVPIDDEQFELSEPNKDSRTAQFCQPAEEYEESASSVSESSEAGISNTPSQKPFVRRTQPVLTEKQDSSTEIAAPRDSVASMTTKESPGIRVLRRKLNGKGLLDGHKDPESGAVKTLSPE